MFVGDESHRSHTFAVEGHHYALVRITDLEPGSAHEYAVELDGERVWPEEGDPFPPPVIRTIVPDDRLTLAFGSCRVSVPHEPPYTLKRGLTMRGGVSGKRFSRDALYALALRMRRQPSEEWPDALLFLGDQIYADDISMGTREFIRSRRDTSQPPGEEVADFEEYTRLYWDAWKNPVIRWLLSTVPSAMIFDDHDVHDDWNTSEAWVRQMRSKPWWEERIVGAFMSYWIYQHLGNLSPQELNEDDLFRRVREAKDATRTLREFAHEADREVAGSRWSFHRDFGNVRLIVMDSRAGRVLDEGQTLHARPGGVGLDRGQSHRRLRPPPLRHLPPVPPVPGPAPPGSLERGRLPGRLGSLAARLGESIRQALDLEHWSAFHSSFAGLTGLLRAVGAGERSNSHPPASMVILSGDVHHGYLAEMDLGDGVESAVYQAVCSPLRNPLGLPERLALRAGWTKTGERIGKTLARLAGVEEPRVRWRLTHEEPWFENHVGTLELRGREATLRVERPTRRTAGSHACIRYSSAVWYEDEASGPRT